jgi:competence protein ComEA
MWKRYFEELFSFSPSQFRGILILLFLIVVATIIKKYIESRPAFNEKELAAFDHRVDSFQRMYKYVPGDSGDETQDSVYTTMSESENGSVSFTVFNPNTISAGDWKKMGVPEKVIDRIVHYEEKGGRFHSADDLKKIYGFTDDLFQKLKPFIKISINSPDSNFNKRQEATERKHKTIFVDINSADTTLFKQLAGIGSKLALRIVKYRDKLGGFYSINQLTEVYGISSDVFSKIKSQLVVSGPVHTILINKMPYDTIVQQPYLKMFASKIIHCRKQNGDFHSLDELKTCAGISDSILQKISPYISLQ